MNTQIPSPGPRASSRLRMALLATLAVALGSCTFSAGEHMEVDFLGARYRFYLYEKPTAQVTVELRNVCRSSSGTARQEWSQCSLSFLRSEVDVPAIGQSEWNIWTGSDQWSDYADAVEDVLAGGYHFDSSNERYALHCLVGDHFGFQDYNWTTRAADDSHCRRGVNA